ncbi:hypothetical protein Cni_G06599 [Canna indica]|uniref:Uncharacterized protein n=1 Tax=Canna indica TaxID=4628 RepID=A0AAQ3JXA5_9LILI|nr:hypothetical protein Cni_G06599 [Canna indica]
MVPSRKRIRIFYKLLLNLINPCGCHIMLTLFQSSFGLFFILFMILHVTNLTKPFSKEEVWHTINSLANGKSPRIDGFTIEFYKSYWTITNQDLLNCYLC